MKIFVLNLEKDVVRRKHVVSQLNNANLGFEFIRGVYGKEMSSADLLRHYDDRRAKWHQARSLTRAEIGCSLSHLKTYQTMIERDIPVAAIFEDDVVLPANLGALLRELAEVLPHNEPLVCLLSPAQVKPDKRKFLKYGVSFGDFASGFYASSYIVTNSAARQLVQELYPVVDVADSWTRLNRFSVVRIKALTPSVTWQDQDNFGSSTTTDIVAHFAASRAKTFTYRLRRARNVIWDFLLLNLQGLSQCNLAKSRNHSDANALLDL